MPNKPLDNWLGVQIVGMPIRRYLASWIAENRFDTFLENEITFKDSEIHVDMHKISRLSKDPLARAAYFKLSPSVDTAFINSLDNYFGYDDVIELNSVDNVDFKKYS